MSVRERRVRDNPPYLDAATTSPSPGPGPSPNNNLWLAYPHPARRSREVIAVSGWRLGTQTSQRQLCRDAVPTLPRYSGCDVIASLPSSAEDEPEEG